MSIPASVTEICNSAFEGCSSLSSVTIANGSELHTIGDSAFKYCAFTSIVLPCAKFNKVGNAAFSGPPWNDPWTPVNAEIHVREILESKQSYCLKYVVDGQVVDFILGASMLFHYGRVFEINDLAVVPAFQGRGIATELLEKCISDVKEQGMVGVNLITAGEGTLPAFYGKHGFRKENRVILMGRELL